MTQSRHTHWRTTLPARSSSRDTKPWRGAAIAGFTALVAAGAAFGLLAVPTVAVADNAEAAVIGDCTIAHLSDALARSEGDASQQKQRELLTAVLDRVQAIAASEAKAAELEAAGDIEGAVSTLGQGYSAAPHLVPYPACTAHLRSLQAMIARLGPAAAADARLARAVRACDFDRVPRLISMTASKGAALGDAETAGRLQAMTTFLNALDATDAALRLGDGDTALFILGEAEAIAMDPALAACDSWKEKVAQRRGSIGALVLAATRIELARGACDLVEAENIAKELAGMSYPWVASQLGAIHKMTAACRDDSKSWIDLDDDL